MTSTERRPLSAHLRLAIAVAVGVVAGGMASLALDGLLAVLVGACGVSLAYVVLAVSVLWPMDAARTRSNSVREDFQPLVQEATVVALSLVNLLTIMVILVRGGTETRTTGAVLGLLGALNLPVIYFSVHWWNTLHQGASITASGASMPGATLAGLLLMTGAAWAWTFAVSFKRVQLLIEEREAHTRWLHSLQGDAQHASYSIAASAHPASAGGL